MLVESSIIVVESGSSGPRRPMQNTGKKNQYRINKKFRESKGAIMMDKLDKCFNYLMEGKHNYHHNILL